MQYLLFAGLAFLVVAGLMAGAPAKPAAAASGGSFGLAMIFVLLTFGGWNEAAYLSGEVRDARRNMIRILLFGILIVTVVYLLVNVAYLAALGLGGMKESKAVAADVTRLVMGDKGAVLIALIVCLAALTTMNAAIFTGARTTYALGRDFAFSASSAPGANGKHAGQRAARARGDALVLVIASAVTPTASARWWPIPRRCSGRSFCSRRSPSSFSGRAISTRRSGCRCTRSFRSPSAPCVYMLYSSINYVRFAVEFGVAVFAGLTIMALGIPLYFVARNR